MSNFLLRLAIAFAFLYPAYAIHQSPDNWLSYIPPVVESWGLSETFIIYGFTALHVIIGLWILSGKKIFLPSLLATLFLIVVVAFNLNQMDVLFRDVSLALIALYLTLTHRK